MPREQCQYAAKKRKNLYLLQMLALGWERSTVMDSKEQKEI
jgi:hypothetical protein